MEPVKKLNCPTDLECHMSVRQVMDEDIEVVVSSFHRVGLRVAVAWCLHSQGEFKTLNHLHPHRSFKQACSMEDPTFFLEGEGRDGNIEVLILSAFHISPGVLSLSVSNPQLAVGGRRALKRFVVLCNLVAERVRPLYLYLGHEYYSPEDFALGSVEEKKIARYTPELLSGGAMKEVARYYGL